MADDPKDPTQTTPEGDERKRLDLPGKGGAEIPVPTRKAVFGDLAKVARPKRSRAAESGPEDER